MSRQALSFWLWVAVLGGPGHARASALDCFGQFLRSVVSRPPLGDPPYFSADEGRAVTGIAYASRTLRKLTADADCYALGRGRFGAVYRVVPHNKALQSWVVKISEQGLEESHQLKLLEAICARRDCGFKVVRHERLREADSFEGVVTKLEDVRGRTLYSLLLDPKIPGALKKLLRQKYAANFGALQSTLDGANTFSLKPKELYFESHADSDGGVKLDNLPMLMAELEPRDLPILVKSDNIVVDPVTLDMTVIDPH